MDDLFKVHGASDMLRFQAIADDAFTKEQPLNPGHYIMAPLPDT